MIIPVELGGAGDRLEDVISAREGVDGAEYALVELFIVYNKANAALAARLWDEEPWAAPCCRSRNLSYDVFSRSISVTALDSSS